MIKQKVLSGDMDMKDVAAFKSQFAKMQGSTSNNLSSMTKTGDGSAGSSCAVQQKGGMNGRGPPSQQG